MADKIEKYIAKISKLAQYQGCDEKTLREVAEKHFEKTSLEAELEKAIGSDKEELKEAKKRFESYLAEFPILEGEIEKAGLIRLIFLEIVAIRLQKVLNQNTDSVSGKTLESYKEMLDEINNQKVFLGMCKNEDEKEVEVHKILGELARRQDAWINQPDNRANYSYKCIVEGSKVLLANFTIKNIEEVEIGEEIIGIKKNNKGKSSFWYYTKQRVLNKIDSGFKEVCEIETNYKNKLQLTSDHEIFRKVRGGTYRTFCAVEDSYGCEVPLLRHINNLDNYYKGILLGFIKSDGWSYVPNDRNHPSWLFTKVYNVSQKVETQALEFLLDFLKIEYSKTEAKSGYLNKYCGSYSYRIKASSSALVDEILELWKRDDDCKLGFLVGMVLGDGSISVQDGFVLHQKKTNKDNLFIVESLTALNVDYCVNEDLKNDMLCYSFRTTTFPIICPKSIKTQKWLKHFFGIRKLVGRTIHQRIISIKKIGIKKVYDLTTECGNFVVNSFIVHNCASCGEWQLIRRRIDLEKDTVLVHPFFIRGGILFNKHVFQLFDEGKITDADVAAILDVKEKDYRIWLYKLYKDELKYNKENNISEEK